MALRADTVFEYFHSYIFRQKIQMRRHVHTHVYARACTHTCTCAHTHTHTHTQMHAHIPLMHAHAMHMHTCTGMRAHPHTHTHTHTHTARKSNEVIYQKSFDADYYIFNLPAKFKAFGSDTLTLWKTKWQCPISFLPFLHGSL